MMRAHDSPPAPLAPRRSAVGAGAALLALMASGLGGCGGGERVATFEPVTDPAQIFLSLTLDQRAINLSTVSAPTLQLTATPRNALGAPMAELPPVIFHSSDTNAVQVDTATGLLTARHGASGVVVTAEIVAPGNIRRADTARVNVIETVPPIVASLSLDPLPGDSAVWYALGLNQPTNFVLQGLLGVPVPPFVPLLPPARALDESATPIDGLAIEYASLDSTIASVDRWTGEVVLHRPGSVGMVARTTAYGVSKVATTTFIVTLPVAVNVMLYQTPSGTGVAGLGPSRTTGTASEYRIAPGGYVMFWNLVQDQVEVTFEDPTQVAAMPPAACQAFTDNFGGLIPCDAGDVLLPPPTTPDCPDLLSNDGCYILTLRIRRFPVPGVYRFSSTTGVTGRIVVSDEGRPGAPSSGP